MQSAASVPFRHARAWHALVARRNSGVLHAGSNSACVAVRPRLGYRPVCGLPGSLESGSLETIILRSSQLGISALCVLLGWLTQKIVGGKS